ncbi:acetyl-CoA carboxylase biotin carboxyl carrier protein [Dactylosporangium vinaceum]|uniref:Biotin carboxyl carrier protein of acetyl-CoA carboxylase n=1 Tax=Dactylosporangium vinaceum TaxID=53362 RepID=A0ABV5M397_9ACTN|nr:biotin/lipoyl-containing protein [Dactylosporangium vinaceum]
MRASVLQVLAAVPERPHRLRVDASGVAIELEWPPAAGAAPAPEPASGPVTSTVAEPDGPAGYQVCAPSVGTFYRAPEPGAAPFVQVGDAVTPGQQVGIIEAMKLMLPINADRAGLVTHVLKQDSESVQYGEPLFILDAA